ncbi:sulfatase-like hydrolase/transferase [Halostagnicola bangensis]
MARSRPNILFLVSDQHNYRCFSDRDEDDVSVCTPTLDRLRQNSATFENAYCAVPLCTPSRFCFLTGRNAPEAGAWGNGSVLRPELSTLPGTLSREGYETCLQGKMHLGGDLQYAGFDQRPYGDLTGQTGHQFEPPHSGAFEFESLITDVGVTDVPEGLRQERNVVDESVSFLREHEHHNPDQPWFLCASFSRPHWPRTAPERFIERYPLDEVPEPSIGRDDSMAHPMVETIEEYYEADEITEEETMRARASYFACVDYLDEVLADLLHTLERDGFLENTVIIYASDHGDMIGEHGLWDKRAWHDDSTRVPLSVQLPEHRSDDLEPVRVETPVSLIDLYPTLCSLANVAIPEEVEGHDLTNSIRTGREPDRAPVVCDHLDPTTGETAAYRMVRGDRYKYVRFKSWPDLVFDMDENPNERRPIDVSNGDTVPAEVEEIRQVAESCTALSELKTEWREAEELAEAHELGVPLGSGNAYSLRNGRIVDADTPIYHPHVLVENQTSVFPDHPSVSADED